MEKNEDNCDGKDASNAYSSAAAFVESGIQDSSEDTCSICLEVFTFEEPCTLTLCNHEFHLQCILEWAQRSQECPMCWRTLAMKESDSQELLDACAHEREIRRAQSVSPPNFLRYPLDDFHFPRFASSFPEEANVERQIMQHLAAAAAGMSRNRGHQHAAFETFAGRSARETRDDAVQAMPSAVGQRVSIVCLPEAGTLVVGGDTSGRNTSQRSNPDGNSREGGLASALRSADRRELEREDNSSVQSSEERSPISRVSSNASAEGNLSPLSGSGVQEASAEQTSLGDSLKTRWAAASSKYRETFSKNTKGIRERFRLRSGAVADLSAKAREMGAGVVRALERMADPGPSGSSDRSIPSSTLQSAEASGSSSVSLVSKDSPAAGSSGEESSVVDGEAPEASGKAESPKCESESVEQPVCDLEKKEEATQSVVVKA